MACLHARRNSGLGNHSCRAVSRQEPPEQLWWRAGRSQSRTLGRVQRLGHDQEHVADDRAIVAVVEMPD